MDPKLNNPLLKKNTKDFWDEKYRTQEHIEKNPSEFLFQHLDDLPHSAKVLDLACGTGRNAVALALRDCEVTGIDFSEVAIEKAEKFARESNVEVQWKKMDLDFFIPELLAYDLIISIDYKLPPTLLHNVIRGLKKNGRLIVEAPLIEAMKTRPELELFECFQPGELLKAFQKPGLNFRILYYSELGNEKLQLIAQKTEIL